MRTHNTGFNRDHGFVLTMFIQKALQITCSMVIEETSANEEISTKMRNNDGNIPSVVQLTDSFAQAGSVKMSWNNAKRGPNVSRSRLYEDVRQCKRQS